MNSNVIALTVQGTSISLPSDTAAYAAIDTGTTLIGGPSEYIAEIYAQIPGSAPATGNFDGYYTYRELPFATSSPFQVPSDHFSVSQPALPTWLLQWHSAGRAGPSAMQISS